MKYLIVVMLVLTGCLNDTQAPDSRFIGSWSYYARTLESDGISEKTVYQSFDFDDSDEVYYYYSYKTYTPSTGWTMFDGADYHEWTVNNTTICLVGIDCWSFRFADNGLYLDDRFFKKD